ncbi:MAG: DUF2691 family protein [Acutalibacteraceae bacterium]|nr:DUF2691 family protein [Acutalibacteraceae bacterium]
MVYGTINRKGEKYYTHLNKVFRAIKSRQNNYNWLITDCECYPKNSATAEMLKRDYCWLSGEELTALVEEEDFQWIWAVLSGFEKDIPFDKVIKYNLPYADGYRDFWENPLTLQHPLASVEIVPWDSTLTLLLSKDKEIVEDFRKAFPYSENLEGYNQNEL